MQIDKNNQRNKDNNSNKCTYNKNKNIKHFYVFPYRNYSLSSVVTITTKETSIPIPISIPITKPVVPESI